MMQVANCKSVLCVYTRGTGGTQVPVHRYRCTKTKTPLHWHWPTFGENVSFGVLRQRLRGLAPLLHQFPTLPTPHHFPHMVHPFLDGPHGAHHVQTRPRVQRNRIGDRPRRVVATLEHVCQNARVCSGWARQQHEPTTVQQSTNKRSENIAKAREPTTWVVLYEKSQCHLPTIPTGQIGDGAFLHAHGRRAINGEAHYPLFGRDLHRLRRAQRCQFIQPTAMDDQGVFAPQRVHRLPVQFQQVGAVDAQHQTFGVGGV